MRTTRKKKLLRTSRRTTSFQWRSHDFWKLQRPNILIYLKKVITAWLCPSIIQLTSPHAVKQELGPFKKRWLLVNIRSQNIGKLVQERPSLFELKYFHNIPRSIQPHGRKVVLKVLTWLRFFKLCVTATLEAVARPDPKCTMDQPQSGKMWRKAPHASGALHQHGTTMCKVAWTTIVRWDSRHLCLHRQPISPLAITNRQLTRL